MLATNKHTWPTTVIRLLLVIAWIFIGSHMAKAQEKPNEVRIGLNYGRASQELIPKKNDNYEHDSEFFKLQLNYGLFRKNKWNFELNIEPGVYKTEHRLLNEYYLKPSEDPDHQEAMERYIEGQSYEEYVINIGFLTRLSLSQKLSLYNLLSVGPMHATAETERLPEGFAFSDVIAFGLFYKVDFITLDFRFSFRHVSNANLKTPNGGHNSAMLESGIAFNLN